MGRVTADGVHTRVGRQEGRGGVDTVWAAAGVLAERAFDDGELGAEIGAREWAPRLVRETDIVDAVERDVVEERDGVRAGDGRENERQERERGPHGADNVVPRHGAVKPRARP